MQITTLEQVAAWLRENNCPMTSMELYYEWRNVHHESYQPFLDIAVAAAEEEEEKEKEEKKTHQISLSLSLSSNTFSTQQREGIVKDTEDSNTLMEQALVDLLIKYGEEKGITAMSRAVKKAAIQLQQDHSSHSQEGSSHHTSIGTGISTITNTTITMNSRANRMSIHNDQSTLGTQRLGDSSPLGKENNNNNSNSNNVITILEQKLHQIEDERTNTTNILSERLPMLIRVVDPMQKDILIPLISLNATLSNTTAGKAASRLLLLTLYTRPNREHRAIVSEAWARALKDDSSSLSENEIVPELFNLANAKSVERRILALSCLDAVAPYLTNSPSQRRSICQGLLFPLSKDESRTVRCHVVQCLVDVWPKISDNDNSLEFDKKQQQQEENNNNNNKDDEEVDLCLSYFVELLLHLALHDSSLTVQGRAFQSLRSQLLSSHVPRRLLLTRIIPLLLSFLERESYVAGTMESSLQSLPLGSKTTPVTANTPTPTTPTPTSSPGTAGIVGKKTDTVVTVSIKNTLVLASLIGDILRYAREGGEDDNEDKNKTTSSGDGVMPSVFEAYLRVVLPSTCALILCSLDQETTDTSICAVASALAVMIPALRLSQWKRVRALLGLTLTEALQIVRSGNMDDNTTTTTIRTPTISSNSTTAALPIISSISGFYNNSSNNPTTTTTTTTTTNNNNSVSGFTPGRPVAGVSITSRRDILCRDGWRRRQMCFLFAFLTCVAGGKDANGKAVSIDAATIAKDAALLLRETLMMAKEECDKMIHGGRQEKKGKSIHTSEREDQEIYYEHEQPQKEKEKGDDDDEMMIMRMMMMMESKGTDPCACLDACATSLACLASYVDNTHGSAAAVSSLLCSLAESSNEKQRLLAVVLVSRVSGLPKDDHVREVYIWPPLLTLMNDTVYTVQEAAVMAAVSMVTVITTAATQEKVLRTALATVEAAGCPSKLAVAFLRHWCSLMRVMPAEPQENLMYPQLAIMIDHLKNVLCKSTSTPSLSSPSSSSSSPSSLKGVQTSIMNSKVTEDTLQAVLDVLAAIPHSAVVTPQLVKRYLIPRIQLLTSVPTLNASSRSQLVSIAKEYDAVMGSGRGMQGATNFFGRVRDEFKKRF
ncbi:uncharacterized protein TM35_000063490 [Trypanosoma theileri]|uniref:Uncharacterized protein n=1 Tax=Trypanosoma theileri TaxID=67003 RepID=A0A1X0P326_9TRYP|nr:uncharacterized protein TM35_000063490 [Trypanosoma theileri]ORC91344.1 hypothetical protein TM35_000063490 [Trypanosoma theileri]